MLSARTTLMIAAVSSIASISSATTLFSSDGGSLSSFTVVKEAFATGATAPSAGNDPDSSAAVIDYSTLGIPEAPNAIAGSAATTGIVLQANKGDTNASITGINLLLGSAPTSFSGTHTLQFDVYMYIPTSVTGGTTEVFDAGVARSTSATSIPIYSLYRSSRGNGGWMFQSNDNGLTTDYRQLDGLTSQVAYGDATSTTYVGYETAAFKRGTTSSANPAPGNQWVTVDLVFDTSGTTPMTSVYMNGVLFSSFATTNTSGLAWLGYEDGGAGIGTSSNGTIGGIFDNITVVDAVVTPEPTSLALLGIGGMSVLARRRRA